MPATLTANERPRLAPGVVLVRHDDIGRLLDLDRGRFFGLNPIATELLLGCLDAGISTTVERLTARFGVPPTVAQRDVESLLGALRSRDLIAQARSKPITGVFRHLFRRVLGLPFAPLRLLRGRGTSSWRVRWLLARAWLDLRLGRWSRVLAKWGRATTVKRRAASETAITDLDRVVCETASRSVLLPLSCKERALVMWHLCRTELGVPAELVIGVQHYPFAAHTWVEIDGHILTDDPEHARLFEPVVRYS